MEALIAKSDVEAVMDAVKKYCQTIKVAKSLQLIEPTQFYAPLDKCRRCMFPFQMLYSQSTSSACAKSVMWRA